MAPLAEQLRIIEAAGLGKKMRWLATRAALELDAGHADESQRDHPQCSRCGEVSERLEAVRPALGALLDGRQPSGAMRRRRNNALHLAAGGRRLDCGGSRNGSGDSGGGGSGGGGNCEPLDEYYGIVTADGACQTSASFPPDADVWFGTWVPHDPTYSAVINACDDGQPVAGLIPNDTS